MDLGKHYIALTVKDIRVSKGFYEKLGFVQDERWGSVEENWITLNNGDIMIGLYQGMFPKNILTFNPKDVRSIQKELKAKGITLDTECDGTTEGPAHISLKDPDGNPILIDQHF